MNKEVDTSVRSLVVEMLLAKTLDSNYSEFNEPLSIETLEVIINCLVKDRSPKGKEFLGFMMSRLHELATDNKYLQDLLR